LLSGAGFSAAVALSLRLSLFLVPLLMRAASAPASAPALTDRSELSWLAPSPHLHPPLSTLRVQDLASFRKFKDKQVSSSARALVSLYRELAPGMLARRERGRGADIRIAPAEYGAAQASALLEIRALRGGSGAIWGAPGWMLLRVP
jgi:hypothetical protein